jgi:hypothetical protein
MDNTEYIESYFTNELVPDQARVFEKRIETDPVFAEEVAFYLSALNISREVAQTQKKEDFKKLYKDNYTRDQVPPKNIKVKRSLRTFIYYAAAAAIIAGIFLGIYTFTNTVSPKLLATQYEKENLQTLGVTMSSHADSIQTGIRLYNDGKYSEALLQFQTIIRSDTIPDAIKYAGYSALMLKKYDEALNWFKELETHSMYSNPAKFYQALTLMDRNQPGDETEAKHLLQQIIQNNLDGKETAEEWLKNMK